MRSLAHLTIFATAATLVAGTAAPAGAGTDDEERARTLLTSIESGQGDRAALAQELTAVAARAIPALDAYLDRAHTTTPDERRALLQSIHASVPDKSGRFATPARQKAQEVQADDDLDWLAELGKVEASMPGLGETFADVAAIRALAASGRTEAAQVILDTAFADDTMVYRDECGRRLRAMMPYSLPALHIGSQSRNKAKARYATYQLERMDRQEPGKAFSATAADEDLRVTLLEAWGTAHHREAVPVVLDAVDDDAPRVRRAAREAWLSYISGPPPPPAPRKKLQLTGGRLAKKETPLWLTWRELAGIELKRTAEEVLGSVLEADDVGVPKTDLVALSKELFAFHDGERASRDGAAFDAAVATATGGDLAGAGAAFDRLLAANPELEQRGEAAPFYLELARSHEKAKAWAEAATAYGKAYGVAPDGPAAVDAQAGREYALGKALEADGKDGSANFRRAIALKPDYAPARAAAGETSNKQPWLLWAAGAGALFALAFLIAGIQRRRRTAR
jgi:tetratricopeptide (TPR) repeat protein